MSFTSFEFILLFLPVFIIIHKVIKNINIKNILLLIFSLFFYAWGEPRNILILLCLMIVCYICSFIINKFKNKYLLLLFVIVLLFPLVLYKYYFNYLPLGISFYTFQLLSYLIDVYMNRCELEKNIIYLSIYFAMFPTICSGPILRYGDVKDRIINREVTIDNIEDGLTRFVIGLSKKIILADNLARIADTAYGINVHLIQANMAWLGAVAYMLQIYFDFSGYSDMAIGLGKMLGFDFKENFDKPYTSRSITEFWRRWHISLGSWFKDYVYIPLGGNRVSNFRWIFNILVVWILTGIWHGSSLNFIVWGLYYGILLIIEKKYLKKYLDKYKFLSHLYLLLLTFGGWIIFRIENIVDLPYYVFALVDIRNLGSIDELISQNVLFSIFYIVLGILCLLPPISKNIKVFFQKNRIVNDVVIILLLVISIFILENGSYRSFIYFNF